LIGAILQGLASGAAYALVAVGLILVFKGSRVLNLAQGEIGATSFLLVLTVWRGLGFIDQNDVTATSLLAGIGLLLTTVVLSAGLGILIERLIMRRLVGRPAVDGTIATLGLAVVLFNMQFLFAKIPFTDIPLFLPSSASSYPINVPPVVGTGAIDIFGANINNSLMAAAIVTAIVGAGLAYFFNKTKFGLGVVAATSDNTVARILGIPVNKVYMFTWGVGGALSGLAAGLIATGVNGSLIKPADMTLAVIIALAAAVIGGLDNVWGGIIGGLLVGVVRAVSQHVFGGVSGVQDLAVLLLVLVTLMARPRGLVGGLGAEVA
jgi:branched-chain amino acid transport system permease protein